MNAIIEKPSLSSIETRLTDVETRLNEVETSVNSLDELIRGDAKDMDKNPGLLFYVRKTRDEMNFIKKLAWSILLSVITVLVGLFYVITQHVLVSP